MSVTGGFHIFVLFFGAFSGGLIAGCGLGFELGKRFMCTVIRAAQKQQAAPEPANDDLVTLHILCDAENDVVQMEVDCFGPRVVLAIFREEEDALETAWQIEQRTPSEKLRVVRTKTLSARVM